MKLSDRLRAAADLVRLARAAGHGLLAVGRCGIGAAQHPFQRVTLGRFIVDPVAAVDGIEQHVELMSFHLGQGGGRIGHRNKLDMTGLQKRIIADGTIAKISQKYFQEDVTCK